MHGYGTFKWPDGKLYIGYYADDKKNGFGKYYWNENFYYEGYWSNSKQHGKGVILDNKKVFEVKFRHSKIIKISKEEQKSIFRQKNSNEIIKNNIFNCDDFNHIC